jgi:hypothetical protein
VWCVCSKVNGYVAKPVDNLLWVHSGCMRPSRPVFEKMTHNRIPRGATYLASVYGRGDGVNELTFLHPEGKKVILTVNAFHRGPHAMTLVAPQTDILLKTWELADREYAKHREVSAEHPGTTVVERAKVYALCEVLAMMMPPFFSTIREVGEELVRRYENRDNPEYETAGLGVEALAEFEHRPVSHGVLTPATAGSAPVALAPDVAENIKKGLASGLFTPAQLAASYKVPIAAVESLRG